MLNDAVNIRKDIEFHVPKWDKLASALINQEFVTRAAPNYKTELVMLTMVFCEATVRAADEYIENEMCRIRMVLHDNEDNEVILQQVVHANDNPDEVEEHIRKFITDKAGQSFGGTLIGMDTPVVEAVADKPETPDEPERQH